MCGPSGPLDPFRNVVVSSSAGTGRHQDACATSASHDGPLSLIPVAPCCPGHDGKRPWCCRSHDIFRTPRRLGCLYFSRLVIFSRPAAADHGHSHGHGHGATRCISDLFTNVNDVRILYVTNPWAGVASLSLVSASLQHWSLTIAPRSLQTDFIGRSGHHHVLDYYIALRRCLWTA